MASKSLREKTISSVNSNSSSNERGIWFYNIKNRSNSSWIPFGDIDNEIVEENFCKNNKTIELDNYFVNLDQMIKISKEDRSIEMPIKRSIRQSNETPLRSERFYSCEKLVKSFSDNDKNDHRFLNHWNKINKIKSINELLEKAAEGIIKEGILLGLEIEGQWIAQQIRSVIGKPRSEIEKCIILLYTYETFLYRIINSTLRENDQSKLDNLGPFCELLFRCDCTPTLDKVGYDGELYRGAQLDEKTIQSYQQSIGLIKTWDAYSSTSKNRKKAESYGNVLFIINHDKSTRYRFSGMDISAISNYPEEEEVLIRAARNFIVQKVDKDQTNGKYFIYLLLC